MASAGCRKMAGVPVLDSVAGELARDDAGLAHAGDDDAARAVVQQIERALEAVVELRDQAENRLRLGLEDAARQVEPTRSAWDWASGWSWLAAIW